MASNGIIGGIKSMLGFSPAPPKPGDANGGGNVDPADQFPDQAEWLKNAWSNCKDAYYRYHASVWEALLMYAGELWIEWNPTNKVHQPELPDDDITPQPSINRFTPSSKAIASNFAAVPEVEATADPEADDLKAVGIATVATKVAKHFMKINALRSDYKQQEDKSGLAANLFTLCGCFFTITKPDMITVGQKPQKEMTPSFGYTCETCGDNAFDLPQPVTTCPVCNYPVQPIPGETLSVKKDPATGQPIMMDEQEVEARCEIGNPIFAVPRTGSNGMADCDWLLWAERKSVDQIHFQLGVEAQPDDVFQDGLGSVMSSSESPLAYVYSGYLGGMSNKNKDSAMVVEAFVQPKKKKQFEEGFHGYMINGQLKKGEVWPYDDDHPLTLIVYDQLPTVFFGRSDCFDMTGLQRSLNKYESLIELHGMTSAVDTVVIDENTEVTEITGGPDRVCRWRSLGPNSKEPHRMQHGTLDDGIYRQRNSLHAEFENVSGAVNVFKGQQPGSITAASAISQLRGQAEQMYNSPVNNWNTGWLETIRKGVNIYKKRASFTQLVKIVGPDHETQIRDFMQCEDMDDLINWVASQHGLPRTRDERRQEMMELFDRGALDPNDPDVKERMYELFGETGMMHQFNADATRARAENKGMKQNPPIPPRLMPGIEDYTVHLSIHTKEVKSLDFDRLPPPNQQLFLEHIMQTQEAMGLIPSPIPGQPPGQSVAPPPPGGGPPPPAGVPTTPGPPASSSAGGPGAIPQSPPPAPAGGPTNMNRTGKPGPRRHSLGRREQHRGSSKNQNRGEENT